MYRLWCVLSCCPVSDYFLISYIDVPHWSKDWEDRLWYRQNFNYLLWIQKVVHQTKKTERWMCFSILVICKVVLRILFVLLNNIYCIPTYVVWMVLLAPLRRYQPDLYWKIEGTFFHWLLAMVSMWSWSAGYDSKYFIRWSWHDKCSVFTRGCGPWARKIPMSEFLTLLKSM